MKLIKTQAHSSAFKTPSSPPSSGVNKGLNRGLFERSEFPKVPLFASNGGTKEMRAAFLLCTFLWQSKEKYIADKAKLKLTNFRNRNTKLSL
jgi:hypothetical protein